MSAHTISQETTTAIKAVIDKATADPKNNIPGIVAAAVNKNGETIFSHASGKTGADESTPATLDNVFFLASCTKMIGGIACMQLVEQGKLNLDDADLVEKLLPELATVQILQGFDENDKPILKDKKNRITLRMLLSHTAGFGYTFFVENLQKFVGGNRGDESAEPFKREMRGPLLFEPGTDWNYGTNIDWAGFMVERATGLNLNEYFHKYIFEPLGLKNSTMFPPESMLPNLMGMSARHPDGHLASCPHLLQAALTLKPTDDAMKDYMYSAGAGGFATPIDYSQIIATLLNNGTSPTTGKQILKKETVDLMFQNQIPDMPDFARRPIPSANPELTNPLPELYPQPHDQPQGWGLTFMLTISPGATGRGANTGWWAGLPNLFWWADREKGVGGIVASQIIPFGDAKVMGLWGEVESMIYQG